MEDINRLLKIRREAQKRKPAFVRRASNYSVRVASNWRNPRGIHSPLRQEHRGRPVLVSIGYRGPKAVRGLHQSGLEMVLVHNLNEMKKINPKTQGVIISGTLGQKKRLDLLKEALILKVRVFNAKDPEQEMKSITENLANRKKTKTEKIVQKSKKLQEKEKRAVEKKKKEEEQKKANKDKALEEEVQKENKDKEKLEEQKTI